MKKKILGYKTIKQLQTNYFRNVFCEYYDECLSKAAHKNLPLNCSKCVHKNSSREVFILTLEEIEGCKRLLYEIFKERKNLIYRSHRSYETGA